MPTTRPPLLRADFARKAIDLAIEHHSAIIGLVMHQHYASAGALLRPLLESAACAFWLMYSASSDRVLELEKASRGLSTADTPTLGDMLKSLKGVLPDAEDLRRSMENKGAGTWLHKFTHGGLLQLGRRGNDQMWSEREILTHLVVGDLFLVTAISVGSLAYDAPELGALSFWHRDMLAKESAALQGLQSVPPQASQLPLPLCD
ncbi:DUF6988 family protein [Xanthomonas graminis]|uniref:DUF6988 family protein n=1 Tax=Xanthomonas graminis TaxID=3390026 RepID=UPI001F3CEC24|nr:hypothetical protein [Xanthomonas translucens]UKE73088.1 hypothetical protein KFS85_19060 [Xanthomonas translucens pv. phleipratensis]